MLLYLDLWYDLKKLLWEYKLNPRVRCAFGNVWEKWPGYTFNLNWQDKDKDKDKDLEF